MAPADAVVFHHPMPLRASPRSGSELRPVKMRDALEDIGFEVVEVTGYSADRRRAMRRVLDELAAGRRYAFAYAETSTAPMALNDRHHLPVRPRLDARFFAALQRAGVPVGVFYRDVYWRFDLYRAAVPTGRRLAATQAFRLEWRQLRRTVDHLFIPSMRMADALPGPWPAERIHALPPGTELADLGDRSPRPPGALRALYVGSVQPPLYDPTWLLDAARANPTMQLTVCCRAEEADRLRGANGANVAIVHEYGAQLAERYARSDVAIMAFPVHPYREFAVPVKLFEAIGAGVPVIANRGTAAGELVDEEGLGWTVGSGPELARLIGELTAGAGLLDAAQRRVETRRAAHSWTARAQRVAQILLGGGSSSLGGLPRR